MRVSAVIPTYNDAGRVKRAIASVLAQTVPVAETVVVDDGSTDHTRDVVAEFGSRVTYIFQKNQGLSAARNTGIRNAASEWIAFLDSDDWWLPDKIALQTGALRQSPRAVLCYTGVRYHDESNGSERDQEANDPSGLWPSIRFRNYITGSGSAVCVRRDCLEEIGGFCEQLTAYEDWDAWFRIALRHSVTAVRQPLTVISLRPSSMSLDVDRMRRNMELFVQRTPLTGLSGLSRFVWRQRIMSAELYRLALILRTRRQPGELGYLLKSLATWPSPFFRFVRYKSLASTLRDLGKPKR